MKKNWINNKISILFLLAAGCFVIAFSMFALYRNWEINDRHFNELVTTQARMGLEFDLAIRSYIADYVRPFAEEHVPYDKFIPELMSTSYVARNVFDRVRKQFPDYIIKFSSANPRNPDNLASPDELKMIEYFNENEDVNKWSGKIKIDGRSYIACFSARRASQSCLKCHGTPDQVPTSLIARYGDIAGFHQPLGKVIAMDTIAIPSDKYRDKLISDAFKGSSIMIVGMLAFVVIIYFLLRELVRQNNKQANFFDNVFESLTHPFYVIDAESNRVIMANSAAKAESGFVLSDPDNGNDIPILPLESIELIKKNKSPRFVEQTLTDLTGVSRFVEIHGYPVFDDDGKVTQIIEHVVDVTKRKAAERELEAIFNMTGHMICVSDMEGSLKRVNSAFEQVLGYSTSDIMSVPFINFIFPEDRPKTRKLVEDLFTTGKEVINFENRVICRNRTCKWLSWTMVPVIDKQVMYCVAHDITDSKKAEKRLLESEERFMQIAESAGEWIWEIDLSGKYTYSNSSVEKILGYKPHEIIGKKYFYDFFEPNAKQKMKIKALDVVMDRISLRDFVNENISRDGKTVILKTNGLPVVNHNGAVVGYRGVDTDITSYVDTVNDLQRAKELAEKASEVKSQFLANMSHEIRTPMNAIIGFSDLLQSEELEEEQMEYVQLISSSGRHLLGIIEDILDFSKIESGEMKLEMDECRISELLGNLHSMVHMSAEEKGIEFEIQAAPELPTIITTDASRVSQCLINLASNAIKFTEHGHVHVKVTTEYKWDKQYIRFDIEDTGIGIAEENKNKIFDQFTQADDSHTRKYGGTGLGLAITKKFAKLLKGKLTVSSELGKGSVFSLMIPANNNKPNIVSKEISAQAN